MADRLRTMVAERHTSADDHRSCVGAGEPDLVGYSRSTSTASPPKPPGAPGGTRPRPPRRPGPRLRRTDEELHQRLAEVTPAQQPAPPHFPDEIYRHSLCRCTSPP